MAPHRDDVRFESRSAVGIDELMPDAAVGTVWFLDGPAAICAARRASLER
jgi:hypothetical protein